MVDNTEQKSGVDSLDLLLNSKEQLLFYDTETVGFHGMMVLLQFAINETGNIVLYEVWKEPVGRTLEIIEAMMNHVNIGFNLAFDHFHLQKLHAIWSNLPSDWIPAEHIEEIVTFEKSSRDCLCIKPYSVFDLLLHSRKGPYQSLMARKDIRIKRIPLTAVQWKGHMVPMAHAVRDYLEQNIELDGIYFARSKDKDAPHWTVADREDKDGQVSKNFADVVLRFKPDGSLKSLAEHALKMKPDFVHSDIALDKKYYPVELGYAPFAEATSTSEQNWEVWKQSKGGKPLLQGYAWPGVIQHHIDHWGDNKDARHYAEYDIVYTRGLYYHFGEPDHGDNDSLLSCMVPSVRWRGFSVDLDGIQSLKEEAITVGENSPINTNRPCEIREYINTMCNDTESSFLEDTTDKARLEEMTQWIIQEDEDCMNCLGGLEPDCPICSDGILKKGTHPAAKRAQEVMDIKIAAKKVQLYDKLLLADRLHASLKITGTLSNRMSGGDGLNVQGVDHDPKVRRQFPMVWPGYVLCGGDFDGFEVTIADAVYNDLDLRQTIVSGKKLHGIFGTLMYPGYTYEQILDSDDNPEKYEFGNMYGKAKSGVFAMIYMGNAHTLNRNQGIPMATAEAAYAEWGRMFPGIGDCRKRIIDSFQPLIQEGGLGSEIVWKEPLEYVESFLGYKRYFTLEYKIVRSLFELAQDLPAEWKACDDIVVRSNKRGEQKAWGALTSALYGAAFGISEGVVRAAGNHEIQSVGAELTKDTQVAVWNIQPQGVSEFRVILLNIHDELVSVTLPEYVDQIADIVEEHVESYRDKVPLIGLSWNKSMNNWAEKSASEGDLVHITYDHDKVNQELKDARALETSA